MNCPECGKRIPDDAAFCGYCGNAVIEKPVQVSNRSGVDVKSHNIKKIFITVSVFSAVVFGIVLFLIFGRQPHSNDNVAQKEAQSFNTEDGVETPFESDGDEIESAEIDVDEHKKLKSIWVYGNGGVGHNTKHYLVYEYDDTGKLKKISDFDGEDELLNGFEVEYDERGRQLDHYEEYMDFFYGNRKGDELFLFLDPFEGVVDNQHVRYEYDNNDNVIKKTYYNKEHQAFAVQINQYDNENNPLSYDLKLNADYDKYLRNHIRYEFQYDPKGNLLKWNAYYSDTQNNGLMRMSEHKYSYNDNGKRVYGESRNQDGDIYLIRYYSYSEKDGILFDPDKMGLKNVYYEQYNYDENDNIVLWSRIGSSGDASDRYDYTFYAFNDRGDRILSYDYTSPIDNPIKVPDTIEDLFGTVEPGGMLSYREYDSDNDLIRVVELAKWNEDYGYDAYDLYLNRLSADEIGADGMRYYIQREADFQYN